MSIGATWTGDFVRTELGIELHADDSRSVMPLPALVGVALRRNPRRAQLLVSTVLAKHVPTDPGISIAAGEMLGLLVGHALDGGQLEPSLPDRLTRVIAADAAGTEIQDAMVRLRLDIDAEKSRHAHVVTLGYAETATGLGHLVAGAIGSYYIHSTRHPVTGVSPYAGFQEEHSHAAEHRLYPTSADWLRVDGTVVLVDDELSTGTTIINTITALHALVPQARWIVATLIDLRSAADRARFDSCAASLGTSISVVCLSAGSVEMPDDVLDRSGEIIDRFAADLPPLRGESGSVAIVESPVAPIRSARFGVSGPVDPATVSVIAGAVRAQLPPGDVLVLGSEEFMALPLAVADQLSAGHRSVRFSTTTRSPIAPIEHAGYAIASSITFASHDDANESEGARFAYNIVRGTYRPTTVVVMPEPGTDRSRVLDRAGLVEALRAVVENVIVVVLPGLTPQTAERTDRT